MNKNKKLTLILAVIILFIIVLIVGVVIVILSNIKKDDKISTSNSSTIVNTNIPNNTIKTRDTNEFKVLTNNLVQQQSKSYFDFKFTNPSSILSELSKQGLITYNSAQNIIDPEGKAAYLTQVRFEDYKAAMLNYVSEQLFEKDFKNMFKQNSNGYITLPNVGGVPPKIDVLNVSKQSENTYLIKTKMTVESIKYERNVDYNVSIVRQNNIYVIDSIEIAN